MILCCAVGACDTRWLRAGVHLVLWLGQAVVDQRLYIHWDCKLDLCRYSGHILVCNAFAIFSSGDLLLPAKCKCRLPGEHRGFTVMLCNGRLMVSRGRISEISVLVGVH